MISNSAKIAYKCSNYYSKDHERTILWNDKKLNINWPIKKPLLSKKDKVGLNFKDFIRFSGKERE